MSKKQHDKERALGLARGTTSTRVLMQLWLDIYTAARDRNLAIMDVAIESHIKKSGNKDMTREGIYSLATSAVNDGSVDKIIAMLEAHLAGKVKMRKTA
jgi:hypothetical protein